MLNGNKVPHTGGGLKMTAPELEAGAYPSRLVQVIGLGLQPQDPFKGEPKDPAYRLHTTYELVDEFMLDEEGEELKDKPRWISEDFPLFSLQSDLAKSTKRYLALDPLQDHGGDWSELVGSAAMVTLSAKDGEGKHKGRVFNNVTAVSTMRAKQAEALPALINPTKVFDPDSPDMKVFWSLPEWLRDLITSNLEYEGSALEKLVEAGPPSSEGGNTQEKPKAAEKPAKSVSEPTETEEEEDW